MWWVMVVGWVGASETSSPGYLYRCLSSPTALPVYALPLARAILARAAQGLTLRSEVTDSKTRAFCSHRRACVGTR